MKLIKYLIPLLILFSCNKEESTGIDLLLKNGKIWTGDTAQPWAEWVSVQDGKIVEVGTGNNKMPGAKETIDLEGKLTLPGFNDSHVHFASAGALLLGINLLDVNDEAKLKERMAETVERLPKGSWITRGDWGAYEAWGVGSDGSSTENTVFTPHRNMIDDLTPDHPVLITRYDRGEGLVKCGGLKRTRDGIRNRIIDRRNASRSYSENT